MEFRTRIGLGLAAGLLWLVPWLTGPASGAPDTPAVLSEVSAALTAGDGAAAERLATSALDKGGLRRAEQAGLLISRGLAHEELGAHDDALADFTQGIEMHALAQSEQARALFDRGVTLDAMNRNDDALADYGAALRLMPRFAAALNNRANLYRRLSRADEAHRDYLAALKAGNPRPEYTYYGLGQLAEKAGNPAAARDFYAKALVANGDYAEAAERLAALGAAPNDAPVVLKPPPVGAPVVLHPPWQVAASGPVALHPPQRQADGPTLIPASFGRHHPGLRPAILDTGNAAGAVQIQLGAWRSEGEAAEGWNHAQRQAGTLLDGLSPQIVPVDLPGRGRFYRLRTGAGPHPASLCAALQARGVSCMPARD